MSGNLIPGTKTEDQLNIVFRPFVENRLAFRVRVRDSSREPSARLSFMHEPRERKGQTAVCTLLVTLPDLIPTDVNGNLQKTSKQQIYCYQYYNYCAWLCRNRENNAFARVNIESKISCSYHCQLGAQKQSVNIY